MKADLFCLLLQVILQVASKWGVFSFYFSDVCLLLYTIFLSLSFRLCGFSAFQPQYMKQIIMAFQDIYYYELQIVLHFSPEIYN